MKENVNIIMLGDSLTARPDWKELLDQEGIINLGVDGDTTKDILNRLDTVLRIKPNMVYIMAGINDMSCSININEIFNNYKSIIEKLHEHKIKVIVQMTLYTTMVAINKKVTQFNEKLLDYCIKNDIETIDLNESFCDDKGLLRQDLSTDGLHLGQNAYKAWAYKIKQHRPTFLST